MLKKDANTTLAATLLLCGILLIIIGSSTQQFTGGCQNKQSSFSFEAMIEWLLGAALVIYAIWLFVSQMSESSTTDSTTYIAPIQLPLVVPPPRPAFSPPPTPVQPPAISTPAIAVQSQAIQPQVVVPQIVMPQLVAQQMAPLVAHNSKPIQAIPRTYIQSSAPCFTTIRGASQPPTGKQFYQIPAVLD